jgi:hypothetical protein
LPTGREVEDKKEVELARFDYGAVETETADYGFGVGGGVLTTRDGTCVTRCFGAGFFLGFLISRLRASLFPMPSSLPQVVAFEKHL